MYKYDYCILYCNNLIYNVVWKKRFCIRISEEKPVYFAIFSKKLLGENITCHNYPHCQRKQLVFCRQVGPFTVDLRRGYFQSFFNQTSPYLCYHQAPALYINHICHSITENGHSCKTFISCQQCANCLF